ncbi:hypothetical protein TDMWS_20960 [Thermodesulfomicrobium sp. WS]|uniref:hypothetical protein n=1 Tax=Thermodesulfomicrobium sp. WS TaxID=3004129 RepID=UPI00248FE314|nr:hypothetical protein [Thermodesulfomicrobium sp. WS]BDV02011.1 hypothetical protein TDMWS_20960 [Thermodesulfomicrobium sp. WS]
MHWQSLFSHAPEVRCLEDGTLAPAHPLCTLTELARFIELVHMKYCLAKPYAETPDYPLVDPRELLPSFEPSLFEYAALPGFSMVIFDRPLSPLDEVFQYDILRTCHDPDAAPAGDFCLLEENIHRHNQEAFERHLPKHQREAFREATSALSIADPAAYSTLIQFLGHMDRAHVFSRDSRGEFYLSGIYASFPSDLDTELKRFGLKIKKFQPGNNRLYVANREFVYQFLMELYGYPISSERKTSAAIFARRLHKMGERFCIKVLGQSDRTITTLMSAEPGRPYPQVTKTCLVRLESRSAEALNPLEQGGYFLDPQRRVLLVRITYRQHKYDPNNVRQERAISVLRQEIIHPHTGQALTGINLIKDSYTMVLKLNDIVRGEFMGRVLYKGREVVENTETHEKRLKFLHAWLTKHQRRMVGYSDEFYASITKVLDSYLFNKDYLDIFSAQLHDVYQEVWKLYSFIQQARRVKQLQDLKGRLYRGKKISYNEMITLTVKIITEFKFEAVNYFPELMDKAIHFAEQILSDRYLVKKYVSRKDEDLTPSGLHIKKYYGRLVGLVDELNAIRRIRTTT